MTQALTKHINYKDLVENLTSGVVVIDNQGAVIFMNQVAQNWLGDVISCLWRDVVDSQMMASPEDGDEILLNGGQKVKIETSAINEGQVVLMHDQTYSRFVQDKLNQQKRLQLLGNMCANLAHQIRNPLCAALIHMDTLTSRYPQEAKLPKVIQNLKAIEQEINAILLFSKSDQTLVEKLKLQSLIDEAVSVSNIESKDIVIDLNIQTVEPCVVLGNKQALVGAFTNVISNAIEASDELGTIYISLKRIDGMAQIDIKDKGQGIPSSVQKQIFEPFFTTKAKGTGLGLAIAKNVIQNHKGDMTLTSKEGHGTQVCIRLPKGEHANITG